MIISLTYIHTLQLGATSFTFLPIPLTVPPVPAPTIIMSTLPVCTCTIIVYMLSHTVTQHTTTVQYGIR